MCSTSESTCHKSGNYLPRAVTHLLVSLPRASKAGIGYLEAQCDAIQDDTTTVLMRAPEPLVPVQVHEVDEVLGGLLKLLGADHP
jgi:hypothetical protein